MLEGCACDLECDVVFCRVKYGVCGFGGPCSAIGRTGDVFVQHMMVIVVLREPLVTVSIGTSSLGHQVVPVSIVVFEICQVPVAMLTVAL